MHSGLFEALRMEPVISCLFLKYYCIVSSMFWSVKLTNISFELVDYLSCAEHYYFNVELLLCELGFRPQISTE